MNRLLAVALALSLAGAGNVHAEMASRRWTLERVGPAGLHKCRAFRRVRAHTAELQKADGGTFTRRTRHILDAELKHARSLPPASVTPTRCGVPL